MTKNEYMKMLEIQLGKFSQSTRQEILEDYENHFAEAMSQGKSEEEIINELGDIQDMIDEIPDEDLSQENTHENSMYDGAEACSAADEDSSGRRVISDCTDTYRKIVADCKATDVLVRTSADDKLYVQYENYNNSAKTDNSANFYQYEKDGVFYVGMKKNETAARNVTIGFLGFHMDIPNVRSYDSGKMIIDIPAGFKELEIVTGSGDAELTDVTGETLSVRTASGDIDMSRVKYQNINVSATSGDIEIKDIAAELLEIGATSGDAELENISAKMLKLSTSSGDVEARNIVAEQTEVRTSSGDSEFSGRVAKYFGRSGSGDQEIEIEGKLSEGEFITGSGDIELKIKDNTGAEITASTGSGDVDVRTRLNVESRLNGYVVGDGSAKISVKTGSGDVDILL